MCSKNCCCIKIWNWRGPRPSAKKKRRLQKWPACLGHHGHLWVTTMGHHKSNRQNMQQVSHPTNQIEAVEDNVEAEKVSNSKIEEDLNRENNQIVKIVQKAEIDQHQGTEAQVPVTADLTKARAQQSIRNFTIAWELDTTQQIVSHPRQWRQLQARCQNWWGQWPSGQLTTLRNLIWLKPKLRTSMADDRERSSCQTLEQTSPCFKWRSCHS